MMKAKWNIQKINKVSAWFWETVKQTHSYAEAEYTLDQLELQDKFEGVIHTYKIVKIEGCVYA